MDLQSAHTRRRLRLAVVTAAVACAHVAAVAVLCLAPRHSAPDPANSDGTYVLASLVSPAHAEARSDKTQPHTQIQKPEAPATPAEDASAPASDTVPDLTPQLSSADATALAAFQPQLSGTAAGAGCNLTQALGEVFVASPEVRQSLDELPVAQRSVANAVMLWDGQWSQDTVSGGKALLRALLIKAVAGARPECLSAVNHGPVLFYVPDATATVVIAIGSGDWRWGDLMLPSAPAIIS